MGLYFYLKKMHIYIYFFNSNFLFVPSETHFYSKCNFNSKFLLLKNKIIIFGHIFQ